MKMKGTLRIAFAVLCLQCRGLLARCLPEPEAIPPESRQNITVDGQGMPLGIFTLDWASARVEAEIYRILVTEKLGFNAVQSGLGQSSVSAVYALAGCPDPHNWLANPNQTCGQLRNPHHITFEVWASPHSASYATAMQYLGSQFPDSYPDVLGSLGFVGQNGMYVLGPPSSAARAAGIALEYYAFYNASFYNVSQYFTSMASIPPDALLPCAQLSVYNSSALLNYVASTGDLAGVVTAGPGLLSPSCSLNRWWLSPACRQAPSTCVPVISRGYGWYMQELMQMATLNNMSVSIATAVNLTMYEQISRMGTLLYWWWPDLTFIDASPRLVLFEPTNNEEWAKGYFRTAFRSISLQKLTAQVLSTASPVAHQLASMMTWTPNQMQALLLGLKMSGRSEMDYACDWLLANRDVWSPWIPSPTTCATGAGIVDARGNFLQSDMNATSCQQCQPGRFSRVIGSKSSLRMCLSCGNGSFSDAYGATQCTDCAAGTAAAVSGQSTCSLCPPGTFAPALRAVRCDSCPLGFYAQDAGSTQCLQCTISVPWIYNSISSPGGTSSVYCPMPEIAVGQILVFIISLLFFLDRLCVSVSHRALIVNISTQKNQVRIRCLGGHGFCTTLVRSVKVCLSGTQCQELDRGHVFNLKLLDKESAELQQLDGSTFPYALESSMGSMVLAWRVLGLFLLGEIPMILQLALIVPINVVVALIRPADNINSAGYFMCGPPALLLFALWQLCLRYLAPRTVPFLALQESFRAEILRGRSLSESPRGPERAISAGQLLQFFNTFEGYILGRSMYYICSNLVMQLTKKERLSYADWAGAGRANWFVSHYWGMAFKTFVRSIEQHAKSVAECTGWEHSRYWICTFANNQWKLGDEVVWPDSSFGLALLSPQTRGTLMILDEEALPFTRSWCLYEVFKTYELYASNEREGFEGLLLGTATGVLNYGRAGLDVSLSLARKCATLKVETAEATVLADKEMIDQLVAEHDGGHDAVNRFIRSCIKDALAEGHGVYEADYAQIQELLESQGVSDAEVEVNHEPSGLALTSLTSLESSVPSLRRGLARLRTPQAGKARLSVNF